MTDKIDDVVESDEERAANAEYVQPDGIDEFIWGLVLRPFPSEERSALTKCVRRYLWHVCCDSKGRLALHNMGRRMAYKPLQIGFSGGELSQSSPPFLFGAFAKIPEGSELCKFIERTAAIGLSRKRNYLCAARRGPSGA